MNRILKPRLTAIILTAMFVIAAFVPQAMAAYTVKQIFSRVSATAGETLATGNIVCIKDADGYAWKANAGDSNLRPAVGIIGKGGAAGAKVEIITCGIVSGWTSLTKGAPGFLSETSAAVTQSSPAYSQQVGVAISATTYFINPINYFDTSAITALGVLAGANPIVLEGATADAYETTIAVTDPTADRTITLPDRSGTVVLETRSVTAKTQANSPFTVTTAYAGQVLTNSGASGAIIFNLPEASTCIGQKFTFAVLAAQNLDINPDDADQILGLTNAAGDAIRNATVGGTVTLMALDATNWVVIGSYGTWSDVN